jgi:hypothetical protein
MLNAWSKWTREEFLDGYKRYSGKVDIPPLFDEQEIPLSLNLTKMITFNVFEFKTEEVAVIIFWIKYLLFQKWRSYMTKVTLSRSQ